MAAFSSNVSSSHILTTAGFNKLPLVAENEQKQKVRLYHLANLDHRTIQAAKEALQKEVDDKGREYKNGLKLFEKEIETSSFLLKEGNLLRLLSDEEAGEIQVKYGVKGKVAEKESSSILELLEKINIQTDKNLVEFYNQADASTKAILLPLFNTMLFIFQKERTVLDPREVKTITEFAHCEHDGIRNGTLNLLIDLFEGSGFRNADYGYGLKYFIDNLPETFLDRNRLLLLSVFDKLSEQLSGFLHTGKDVNHEIEPVMAALISASRGTLRSGIQRLDKGTKDEFYKKLKTFYCDEVYSKKITSLFSSKNYLLIFESLWPTQHLIRISSSEHKAVTVLRKTGHGLYALRKLAGAPLKAGVKLYQQGELPDESIIPDLKAAYKHGKKALGIKDIPRPWFEMLEETEVALMDPAINVETLDRVYELAEQYDEVRDTFYGLVSDKLKEVLGNDEVSLKETKEFTFGFVGQLSDIAMDHPDIAVRYKAIELLGKLFDIKRQSQDVRIFVLTTLQNILIQEGFEPAFIEQVTTLQTRLHQRKKELVGMELFRKSKYPCLIFVPESSMLLDAAKTKLGGVSRGNEVLPMSRFIYGSKDITIFKQKVTVGGNFKPRGPDPISLEMLDKIVEAALKFHAPMVQATGGKLKVEADIGNTKKRIFEAEVIITGDFEG